MNGRQSTDIEARPGNFPGSCRMKIHNAGEKVLDRDPLRERGDNVFPRCALIRGMRETSNADWLDQG